MAAYEVLLLNTAVPQIQAAQSGDTYVVPRDIAFSAALTLSAGTANGVPYLNGSKVLTTGSALTFDGTNLGIGVTPSAWSGVGSVIEMAGNAYISSTSQVLSLDTNCYFNGTNWVYKSSSYANRLETVFGEYRFYTAPSGTAGNAITFTQAMTLDANGNLGIGTSSPGARLHVQGSQASGTANVLYLDNSSVTGTTLASVSFSNAGLVKASIAACVAGDGYMTFSNNNNTEKMRLDAFGNLGLGVTPSAWWSGRKAFQVGNTVASIAAATSGNTFEFGFNRFLNSSVQETYVANGAAALYTIGAGAHTWYNAPSGTAGNAITFTQAMALDASGNLGLGVTPSAWGVGKAFEVGSLGNALWGVSSNDVRIMQNAYYSDAERYASSTTASMYRQSSGIHQWFTAPSGTAGNAISFTQALTLDDNRNLLLNGTSAGASAVGTFAIFNGTAPTGSVTNGIILYAEDVSSSSELKVRDEAGNVTTLSPHNFSLIPDGPSEDMAWAYYSEKGGKRINVDMLKLARMVEKLTGEKLVYEN